KLASKSQEFSAPITASEPAQALSTSAPRMHVADIQTNFTGAAASKGGAVEFRMVGNNPNQLVSDVPIDQSRSLAYGQKLFPEYADHIQHVDIIKSSMRPGYRLRISFDDPAITQQAAEKMRGFSEAAPALPAVTPPLTEAQRVVAQATE